MANVPQQSTESQDAQILIELIGRNDPDINTNFLLDKFTQKHGETATSNLITHLFSIGLVEGGHRGMIHMPPTEKNKDYRDVQRIKRFMKPIVDQFKQYQGTGNPIPEELRKRYTRVYNKFIAPFEERRAIKDMQKYFASRPDMSMEERQMRMMKMRQELAENRRRATGNEYFDMISRPRPQDMAQQAVDPKTGKPYTQEQLQNIMNQREAARRLQQATSRFNQLMNQQRKADAFNARPESERNGLMAAGLTDKEKEEVKQLQAMLQQRVMPTQTITDEQRDMAIKALNPDRKIVDAPRPPTQTKEDKKPKIKKPPSRPPRRPPAPAGWRRDPRTGKLIQGSTRRIRRREQTTDTKTGMGNRRQFTATGYYGPADRFYTYGTGPAPNFTKDNFTKQQAGIKPKGTFVSTPISIPKPKMGLGSMQGPV
tara:strand:- start:1014 stop:2294 length:1281 start_codon:yes stop_codon:yes gene_type:complete